MKVSKRTLIEILLLLLSILVLVGVFIFTPKQRAVKYDCSIAEISPDIPVEVKQKCRQLRSNQLRLIEKSSTEK